MSKTDYISVSGCTNGTLRLAATSPATILDAYTNAAGGAVMEMQAVDFTEGIVFNQGKTVTLKGGFNCEFSSTVDYTTINGVQRVRSGKVIVERIKIRKPQ